MFVFLVLGARTHVGTVAPGCPGGATLRQVLPSSLIPVKGSRASLDRTAEGSCPHVVRGGPTQSPPTVKSSHGNVDPDPIHARPFIPIILAALCIAPTAHFHRPARRHRASGEDDGSAYPQSRSAHQRHSLPARRGRASSDAGHLPRLARKRKEPRSRAGCPARRMERHHLQLPRLMGQPGRLPIHSESGRRRRRPRLPARPGQRHPPGD